jgi:RNA polymerase sigma-70 factor (ECF subfamily)
MNRLGPDEFARLLRQHLPRLTRLAIRLCGDPHAAEDVVGDALLRAARHYSSFRGESAFATWLIRILINCFRDTVRARQGPAGRPSLEEARDPAAAVVDQAFAAELAEQVARCVSALPPRQREALVLTVYEGMDSEEAAAAMQTNAQNVRVLVHHARQRLRQQLGSLVEVRHE